MSGETAANESAWTIDSTKDHLERQITDTRELLGQGADDFKILVEQRFADQEKAVQAALVAQEKAVAAALTAAKEAVDKAQIASEKRFDSVNEFRAQLADQASTFMPRNEAEQRMSALAEKISDLTDRMNITDGTRSGQQLSRGAFYAALGAAATIIGLIVLLANNVIN